jgi:hypothetical protein
MSRAPALVLSALLGCAPSASATPSRPAPNPVELAAPEQLGPPVEFAWTSIRGGETTSEAMRGRTTLLVFGTTYDVASQAQVRFVTAVVRRHTPRINALLVVLEQPENRILVEAFANAFDLPYPVALADAPTIAGEGAFRGLHHVPSIVVLDAARARASASPRPARRGRSRGAALEGRSDALSASAGRVRGGSAHERRRPEALSSAPASRAGRAGPASTAVEYDHSSAAISKLSTPGLVTWRTSGLFSK